MPERIPVLVVGAGPAGLALSYELTQAGVEHVVFERGRVGESWRGRWDSFCLVTPNWTVKLPGGTYDGPEPDGFMARDAVVEHLERYAKGFDAPVRDGISVLSLDRTVDGFRLSTSEGDVDASVVALATGAYQRPHRPPSAAQLPSGLLAIDAEQYANPNDLPEGAVVVVGSGQTGCQIADELNRSGREVILACGKAPWVPRRIDGRDIVSWVAETPFMEHTVADLPSPEARLAANMQATGRDGGRDLHYRTLLADGVTLAGRFLGAGERSISFASDLEAVVAWGDARYADVRTLLQKTHGDDAPEMPDPAPFKAKGPTDVRTDALGAVIFTTGFRPDYGSWVHIPDAFDGLGFPVQSEGESMVAAGLFFMGTHFLRTRKSATLFGMGEDAAVVARGMAARLR